MTEHTKQYFSLVIYSPHAMTTKQLNNICTYMQASCEEYLEENTELGLKVNMQVLGSIQEKGNLPNTHKLKEIDKELEDLE